MPIFDYRCKDCGAEYADRLVWHDLPACVCGGATEKLWRGQFPNVVDDSIPGGETIENLEPNPVTFYSRSEKRLYLKQHGIEQRVRHMGNAEGGDRSPHTSRWV